MIGLQEYTAKHRGVLLRGGREIFDGVPARREEGRVVAVIEGPPDEIVHLKYIEEARPRETGKRREKILAPITTLPPRTPRTLPLSRLI
jgi:hypothetical protein